MGKVLRRLGKVGGGQKMLAVAAGGPTVAVAVALATGSGGPSGGHNWAARELGGACGLRGCCSWAARRARLCAVAGGGGWQPAGTGGNGLRVSFKLRAVAARAGAFGALWSRGCRSRGFRWPPNPVWVRQAWMKGTRQEGGATRAGPGGGGLWAVLWWWAGGAMVAEWCCYCFRRRSHGGQQARAVQGGRGWSNGSGRRRVEASDVGRLREEWQQRATQGISGTSGAPIGAMGRRRSGVSGSREGRAGGGWGPVGAGGRAPAVSNPRQARGPHDESAWENGNFEILEMTKVGAFKVDG
ncbi:uncharacterized protein LOC131876781 [Cryptomeria japonica]|uniref:uncharacterized protein LOC131876781 n=1 Tax=Cryptomeria japonica TaxID=3369 RepID=UPI0027DA1BFD|nr:uncharacterized protein LOC131876781 [Cryptomeria japonica]